MIKNFVFDFGNVLTKYDIALYIEQIRGERCDEILNYTFSSPEWKQYDAGLITADEMKEYAKSKAPKSCHDTIDTLIDTFEVAFTQYDEMLPVVKRLKELGYKTFLLSNFPYGTYEKVAKTCPILDYIDNKVVSYKINIVKPNREIYEYLLDTYSLKADECLFADDCKINVAAAKEVGMYAHVFTTADNYVKYLNSLGITL